MIKVTNWVATIPEEDKRLAYVGENEADTRQFLLTETEAQVYQSWGFHLDMAFDLSTVTTVSTHTQQTTHETQNETMSETKASLTATTTKENRDVTDVTVDCQNESDVASLTKDLTAEGLVLTWTIRRQHTLLPGKLRATLRAVSPTGQVKKSALMVFYVEPAVAAEPAATVPLSEFEEMEQRLDAISNTALAAASEASAALPEAREQAQTAVDAAASAALSAKEADESADLAVAAAEKAETKVESIYERNNRLPVSLWVGTQAEYEAIDEKENNRLYLVSDDPEGLAVALQRIAVLETSLQTVTSRVTTLEDQNQLKTYTSLKQLGITSFPTTMRDVALAMPINSMVQIDTRHIIPNVGSGYSDQVISDWGNTLNGMAQIQKGNTASRVSIQLITGSATTESVSFYYGNYASTPDKVNWNNV